MSGEPEGKNESEIPKKPLSIDTNQSVDTRMKTNDGPDTLIVCITGDIDDFHQETPDCLDRYFSVLHNFNVTGTFFITAQGELKHIPNG